MDDKNTMNMSDLKKHFHDLSFLKTSIDVRLEIAHIFSMYISVKYKMFHVHFWYSFHLKFPTIGVYGQMNENKKVMYVTQCDYTMTFHDYQY